MSPLYDVAVNKIDGAPARLAEYKGKVLLVVNVASKCGLTPQYEGLEKLYEEKRASGLEVLGFPANNFGAQEPGTNEEIAEFCHTKFDVQFPMFAKISVKGADQHPLYKELIAAQPAAAGAGPMLERFKAAGRGPEKESDVLWNFEKFLVNRKGDVVARFAPSTAPNDPALNAAIDAELAKPV
jgi:glutathione peroxidase